MAINNLNHKIMSKLRKFFRTPKLTEREEMEKQIIEAQEIEADYYKFQDGIDEDEEDSIWDRGMFI